MSSSVRTDGARVDNGRRIRRSVRALQREGPGQVDRIQRAATLGAGGETIGERGGDLDADTDRVLRSSRSGGRPLPDPAKSTMESAFGADFSGVRVHAGSTATELNDRIQAKAFTTGNDIYFRDGLPDVSNSGGQELLAHELTHTIQQAGRVQRRMPTNPEWAKSTGTTGTVEFTQITLALNEYNGTGYEAENDVLKAGRSTYERTPEERILMVQAILDAISTWKAAKWAKFASQGKNAAEDSKRAEGVAILKNEAEAERTRLQETAAKRADPKTPQDVYDAAQEIYFRGMHAAFRFIGLEPTDKSKAEVLGYWKSFRTEAAFLDRKAVKLSGQGAAAEATNADLLTLVIREGMRAFRTVTYSHLRVTKDIPVADFTNPELIRASITARMSEVAQDASNGKQVTSTMKTVLNHIDQLVGLSGAKKWAVGIPGAELGADDQLHLDLIDSMFTAIDQNFTLTGYLGTDGQGNEGFEEGWKTQTATDDSQNKVAAAFTSGGPQGKEDKARVSGSSDIMSALGGLGGDAVAAYGAWKDWKDPSKSKLERASAMTTLVGTSASGLANTLKFAGGAAHMAEVLGGAAPKSNFLPSNDSATAATDVKMAGDVVGLFAGVLGTISKFLDFLQSADDAAEDPKAQERPLATYGLMLRDDVALVTSLASNVKAGAKLAHQIGGDATSKALASSQVFPAMGLLVSVLDVIRSAQHVHRFRIRRNLINTHIKAFDSDDSGIQQVQALELVADTLTKRLTRAGLDLSRGILQTAAGIANLTGVGLAPGLVIGLAATASEVGQYGARTGKKALRERKGSKREAAGKEEAYAHWKLRKHLESAESGPWARLKTRINIKVTANWDKVKGNKAALAKTAALEILDMDERIVFEALGIVERLDAEADVAKRIKIVVDALEKR